ncbi:hypothetical protein KPH14_004607 [Odynerus spinipes]|uniref:Carbohydrate kinase PfkB domain-containing protein n=1 Tax=Odynerus spinipes TaxID=1348599 RepID=A0AAD9RN91_9HYME|nr:hypothetical protein KPH14_004607 [Odynerus spinipes]
MKTLNDFPDIAYLAFPLIPLTVERNDFSSMLGERDTRFISVVGNDELGGAIFQSLKGGGGTLERSSNVSTARCTVVVDAKGECRFVVGEMDAFRAIDTDLIRKYQRQLEEASIIVIDANLPADSMALTLEIASHAKIPG